VDTTTVNFAINRIEQSISKIAPSVKEFSQEYVRFVVFSEMMDVVGYAAIFLACAATTLIVFKTMRDQPYDGKRDLTEGGGLCTLFGAGLSIAFFIVLVVNIWEATVAYNYPEMFTVQRVIDGAK
jgi:hypothetical protein